MTQISIIGLDIAKSVFQFEAQDAQGAVVRTERLSGIAPFLWTAMGLG